MSKEDEPVTSQQAPDDGQVHVRFTYIPLVFMAMSSVMLFISIQWDLDVKHHKSVIAWERDSHKKMEEAFKVESTKRDECEGRWDRAQVPEPSTEVHKFSVDNTMSMVDCIMKQTAWTARVAAEVGMPEENLRKSLKGDLSALDSLTRRQRQKLLAQLSDFPNCMGDHGEP